MATSKLSQIARNPKVKAFFERGERGTNPEPTLALPPRPRILNDGAAETPAAHRYRDEAATALAVHLGLGQAAFLARVLEDA